MGTIPNDNMYQRSQTSTQGTVVPGMHNQAPGVQAEAPAESGAPVVGFLYSISRKGIGEFWPVHVGRNTIGRDAGCDIRLLESSVSGVHAALNVKIMKSDGRIVAQIRDEGSKNGITVNGEELDFGIHECHSNDIIVIGDNYQLLLLLIDAEKYGLKVSESFIAVDDTPAAPSFADNGFDPYNSANRAVGGTQAIDGTNDYNAGGTKFL